MFFHKDSMWWVIVCWLHLVHLVNDHAFGVVKYLSNWQPQEIYFRFIKVVICYIQTSSLEIDLSSLVSVWLYIVFQILNQIYSLIFLGRSVRINRLDGPTLTNDGVHSSLFKSRGFLFVNVDTIFQLILVIWQLKDRWLGLCLVEFLLILLQYTCKLAHFIVKSWI